MVALLASRKCSDLKQQRFIIFHDSVGWLGSVRWSASHDVSWGSGHLGDWLGWNIQNVVLTWRGHDSWAHLGWSDLSFSYTISRPVLLLVTSPYDLFIGYCFIPSEFPNSWSLADLLKGLDDNGHSVPSTSFYWLKQSPVQLRVKRHGNKHHLQWKEHHKICGEL